MKVKIFQAKGEDGIKALENELNGWINPQVHIERVEQSLTGSEDGRQHFVMSIWYEDGQPFNR